jgi:hypothetical protein
MSNPTANGAAGPEAIPAATIADWLRIFFAPGDVVELRALDVERRKDWAQTENGYFDHDHLGDMAQAALDAERYAVGVYYTINPLLPAILSLRANRTGKARAGRATSDIHVRRRKWLLVDADPVREVAGIPSTDEEKAAAWKTINRVRDYLAGEDWPDPVLADSGNGYHLLYPIDLPVQDKDLVKRCLLGLGAMFDTDRVKIDKTVFNPARITKLYGTLSRKGDHTEERPHRRSRILDIPEGLRA